MKNLQFYIDWMEKNFDTFIYYFPFISLGIVFVIKILFFIFNQQYYSYDEIIVASIGAQPVREMLNSIIAEPHPIGFYLFTKIFQGMDLKVVRVIITTLHFALVLLSLVYLCSLGVIKKYKAGIGIGLFFTSYTFIFISSTMKQDLLSFPLSLFIFSLLISFLMKKDVKKILIINLLLCLLLFLGYIPYLITSGIVVLVLFIARFFKFSLVTFISSLFLVMSYILTFGSSQFLVNENRFGWVESLPNSLLSGIISNFGGSYFPGLPFLGILIIFFIAIVAFSFGDVMKNRYKEVLLLILSCLVFFGYFTHGFVRPRYVVWVYFVLYLFFSWGLTTIVKNSFFRFISVVVFWVIALSGGLYGFISRDYFYSRNIFDFSAQIEMTSNTINKPIGLVSNHSVVQFLAQDFYIKNSSVIPVDLITGGGEVITSWKQALSNQVSFKHSKTDSSFVNDNIMSLGLNNYIYTSSVLSDQDREKGDLLFEALSSSCAHFKLQRVDKNPRLFFYVFTDCIEK